MALTNPIIDPTAQNLALIQQGMPQAPVEEPVQPLAPIQQQATPEDVFNYKAEQSRIAQMRELARTMYDSKAPEGKMISGWYVPPSGTEVMAHALSQMMGAYTSADANTKADQAEVKKNQQLGEMLNQFGGGTPEDMYKQGIRLVQNGEPELGKAMIAGSMSARNTDAKGTTQIYLGDKRAEVQTGEGDKNRASREGIATNNNATTLEVAGLRQEMANEKAQRAQELKVQESNKKFNEEKQKKLVQLTAAEAALNDVDKLLVSNPTHSGGGALIDKGMDAVGLPATDGAKVAAQLKIAANPILMSVPRFEGPQSDKDTATYKEAAGQLGDETISIGKRQAAAAMIREILVRNKLATEAMEPQVIGNTTPPAAASTSATPAKVQSYAEWKKANGK